MSKNTQGESGKNFIELSAKLVHDVSTPMAIAKVNNDFIARYLPTLLSAYESLAEQDQHPERNLIPADHLEAIAKAPDLIKEQCTAVEQRIKAHWQTASGELAHKDMTRPSPGASIPQLHILLVEDEEVHQDIAHKLLAPVHHLDIASNGREALKRCESKPYDLVLMDICLPDLDGRQATKLIRRTHRSDLTIIALSNMPISEQELHDTGFDGQMNKPLSLDALTQYLQNAMPAPRGENSE